MLDALGRDLRYAVQALAKSPAFSLAAIAALTLGIGVNTATFSVVNAVLLKPLPFPEPDRSVFFLSTSPDGAFTGASPAKFLHFREQTQVTPVSLVAVWAPADRASRVDPIEALRCE